MRVLVTGAGGELGSLVVGLLEADPSVEAVAGTDLVVPRRRPERSSFATIDPRDRPRLVALVQRFAPTAIAHLGVYEPDARTAPSLAAERTRSATLAVLGAAAALGDLDRIVVRSGIEVYGRARGCVSVPDETCAAMAISPFGRSLWEVERLAADTGHAAGIPVAMLRLAPVLGPQFPSPLGRVLRLPFVPMALGADPTFSVVHVEDAARAVVAALHRRVEGPVNVVGPGAVSVFQAIRLGGGYPVPLVGPLWDVARRLTALVGAPLPVHHLHLLLRGRTADGGRAGELLGLDDLRSSREVVRALHTWATPTLPLQLINGEAA